MATSQVFANGVSYTDGNWADTTNVYANDDNVATTPGIYGDDVYFRVTFPSSSIPEGATITGSVVRVRFKVSTTLSAHTMDAKLTADSSTYVSGVANSSEYTSLTDIDLDSGHLCTVSELNATTMKARINLMRTSATACTYSIDSVSMITTYTTGLANLKTYNTNAKANIKSINTNLIANVKSVNTNV